MSIFISSTPTIEEDDLKLARELLAKEYVKDIEVKLPGFEDRKHLYTNTGRGSLYTILKALDISKGDEIIIQSFTCMALVVPLIWLDITPVYADIDLDTYNMALDEIKRKISKRSRAVIVQHTFGIPAEIEKIKEYIDQENEEREPNQKIYLIEDCAHCLNIKLRDKYLGSFGDVSFFSFGQDKVVSTTQGGCIVVNNPNIEERMEKEYEKLSEMPASMVKYNLRYPLLWNVIKKTYFFPKFLAKSNRFSKFTVGKFLIILFRFLGLTKEQASKEDFGNPNTDVYRLSLKQKYLLRNQLEKIDRFTEHRKKITAKYSRLLNKDLEGSLMRYPVAVDYPYIVKNKLQKEEVIIGNWYNYPVIPKDIDLKRIQYHVGSCPNTEYIMEHMINLPTSMDVTEKDVERIVDLVKENIIE
jgi:dTDP-4-amino-4,6-dideoxygalactose transaminase